MQSHHPPGQAVAARPSPPLPPCPTPLPDRPRWPVPAAYVHTVASPPSALAPPAGDSAGEAAEAPAGASLGLPAVDGYEAIEEVGRGGMGVVYLARQLSLGRLVALKMLLPGADTDPTQRALFRAEAEAAARLQHPHIVQVHAVGEQDGRPFLAMEYVPGGTLARRLAAGPLPPNHAAGLVASLAGAVAAAHAAGVLHRDLKPANVLLAEPPPGGTPPAPKVVDFGLAKRLGGPDVRSERGAVCGTPAYMAPEQALGGAEGVGPACDVYALGAVLFECLTGRPPFQGKTRLEVLRRAVEDRPAPPRELNPTLDRELEAVCLRCLEKSPGRRYPSASALGEDLARYLAGEPVRARAAGPLERLARLFDRSRHADELRGWGATLTLFAAVVMTAQAVLFHLAWRGSPFLPVLAVRLAQFALMALVVWGCRRRSAAFTSPAGRRLLAAWLGYLAACTAAAVAWAASGAKADAFEAALYPCWCVLSGLMFWLMGAAYWGRFYTYAVAFFALAAAAPLRPEWSPLAFGLLWGLTLLGAGRRLSAAPAPSAHRGDPSGPQGRPPQSPAGGLLTDPYRP
jgi:hypothetical protein